MKNLTYLFFFFGILSAAQVERTQIKGQINTELDTPLTGITVFNGNSLEGTVTNENGEFYIEVTKGDQLSFKAVQFESFSLEVSEKVIQEKKITLSLNANVQDLDVVNVSLSLIHI